MLYKHFIEGGPQFMFIVYSLGLAVLILGAYSTWKNNTGKSDKEKALKLNRLLLFLGSFAFMAGVLGQVLGMMQAFQVIQELGDVSPALIAGGIYVSLLAPVYGFVFFIISYILWFINKNYFIKI